MKNRLPILLCAAGLVALTLPASGRAAPAAHPAMNNISPADYSIIAPVSSIEVQFTCPSYNTTYAGTKDWSSYAVHFSTSPIRSIEGDFAPRNEIGIAQASLVPGTTATCRAFLAEPHTQTPDTYYWFAERINCDAKYCAEFSPLFAFSIVKPAPPGGSGKQPRGSTGGVRYLNAYIGCGVSKGTETSSSCSSFDRMGAFFESNQPVGYKVCIRTPKGKTRCRKKQAQANTLYVNKITARESGRYRVTWTVEGRTINRYVRRLAGAAGSPPAKLQLSYGKAQAEAQKSASDGCNALADCQFWAASCLKSAPANFNCILSTWSPSIPGFPVPWIRCDSETIVQATRYGVEAKGVTGSSQCYSSPA